MRLFLATMTVGAAGIGYAFIHHPETISAETESAPRSLFDWQSAEDPVNAATEGGSTESPLIVHDTISQTRSEIVSTLDGFVRDHVESNPGSAKSGVAAQDIVSSDDVLQTQHSEIVEPIVPEPVSINPDESFADPSDLGFDPTSTSAAESANQSVDVSEVTDRTTTTTIAKKSTSKSAPATKSANEATLKSKKPAPITAPSDQSPTDDSISQESVAKPSTQAESSPGKTSGREKKIDDSGWRSVGKTTRDLPIHSRHFGADGARTLVIAGIDGRDSIAVGWNDQLANSLAGQPDLFPANEIQIFRAGNPDGLVKGASANARGVQINRNFPSRRFQLLPDNSSGLGPVSEVETKAILDVMYTFRPRRVIHLTSTSGTSRVYYNRAAKEVALELEQEHKLEIRPLDMEAVPGSVEDFSDGTLDAAVVTMQLSTGSDWQKAWKAHLPAVLTAINGRNLVKMQAAANEITRLNEGMRIPASETSASPAPKVRRGYEELPPPPR